MAAPPTSGDAPEGGALHMKQSVIYSTGQVARMLGLTEPQLNNHLRRGHLPWIAPGPGGRRLWTQQDVSAAQATLAARRGEEEWAGAREDHDVR